MGTRYSKGDKVNYGGQTYEVAEVQNPESDSPDYLLGKADGEYTDTSQFFTVKASDLKKVEEDSEIDIVVEKRSEKKTDSFFYARENEIASKETDDAIYSLEARGVVNIIIDEKKYGTEKGLPLIEAIDDYDINSDKDLGQLETDGELEWQNNNWFEILKKEKGTDSWVSTDEIYYYYDEAIQGLKDI